MSSPLASAISSFDIIFDFVLPFLVNFIILFILLFILSVIFHVILKYPGYCGFNFGRSIKKKEIVSRKGLFVKYLLYDLIAAIIIALIITLI